MRRVSHKETVQVSYLTEKHVIVHSYPLRVVSAQLLPCHNGPGAINEFVSCRPFVQRYMILVANGRGAYHPVDVESMDQAQAGEYVRKILQAARVDGWQV